MPVPASRLGPTVAAKWAKMGAIMNAATARMSSTIANTRWRLADGSEKPATNSAGATVAPRPMPVSPEPMSVERLARRHVDAEDRDPGREEHHSGQREIVDRTSW